MTRRLGVVGALLLVVFASSCARPPRPHVVVIVIDTLRADHTSAYGYARETTPNLARMAEQGVRFERAWAQAPWTLPSMVSLFTGRYVTANYASVPASATTLAERMKGAGYSTAAVVANPLLFEGTGFERGFDAYEVAAHDPRRKTMRADDVTRLARAHIEAIDGPFFGWFHLYDPHYPYRPPARLKFPAEPVSDARVAELAGRQPTDADEVVDRTGAENIEAVIRWYDGEIRYADEALGSILAALDARGILDETLVIVTSDHGEGMYEHAELADAGDRTRYGLYISHGDHVFEEALHVPFVLRGPGFRGGAVRTDLAGNVDVAPTLLAAAGLEPDPGAHGRDLGAGSDGPPAMFAFGTRHHAVRARDGRKLIHASAADPADESVPRRHRLHAPGSSGIHLYDLAADPGERRDLAAERPDDVEFLRTQLEKWRARSAAGLGGTSRIPQEMTRRLRELGYTK